jgi:hypothetical protein
MDTIGTSLALWTIKLLIHAKAKIERRENNA